MSQRLGRLLHRIGIALGLLIALFAAIFGLAQTPPGQRWLGRAIAEALSGPDFLVSIDGLDGLVPFHFEIARIEIGDAGGTYLTLHNLAVRVSPTKLLSGRVSIGSLTIGEIDMARLPSSSGSSRPLAYYLHVPQLPTEVALERLVIERLALGAPVAGDRVISTIEGRARIAGDSARISFDLRRVDGRAGSIALAITIIGTPPVLSLRLSASEPTGILIDRLLDRRDHLPFALSVDGIGPIADWHGLVTASAGAGARLDANVSLAAADETGFGLSGTANLASLLPIGLAPIVGDRVRLAMHARLSQQIALGRLTIDARAGTLMTDATLKRPNDLVAAHLHTGIPDLSLLSPLLGAKLGGSGSLSATLADGKTRPTLTANLSIIGARAYGSSAAQIEVKASAIPLGPLGDRHTRITVAASGRLQGLVFPGSAALPPSLGRELEFSLAGGVAGDGSATELRRLTLHGMGLEVTGAGRMAGAETSGRLELAAADLRPFSGFLGHPVGGSARLAANVTKRPAGGLGATFDGSTGDLHTGIAMADALFGGTVTMKGAVERAANGGLSADHIDIDSAAANLSGNARFDPASQHLDAALTLAVARLDPLGKALGAVLRGTGTARVQATGVLDRLAVKGDLDGRSVAVAGVALDQVQLAARTSDLATLRAEIEGSFGARGLEGTVALTALAEGGDIAIQQLRLTAAGSSIAGALRIARDTGLIRGKITGRVPDLARWSKLVGKPIGGSLEFTTSLDVDGGQRFDLSATGGNLSAGNGSSLLRIGRLGAAVRLANLRRIPSISGRLALIQGRFGAARLAAAKLTVESPRPGRFAFDGDAKGQPLSASFAGEGALIPDGVELRLNRLIGSVGGDRLALQTPLIVSRRASDIAVSGLDLRVGSGRISGSGEVRGDGVTLAVAATDLSIASGARTLGYRGMQGELSGTARIGGTLGAPRGHLMLTARDLDLSAHIGPGGLGLAIAGDWNGRDLAVHGQVRGLKGDNVAFGGSVPLRLARAPFGISVPADGRLALNLRGSGRLENLADLLPLGEDRIAGRFSADVSLAGTVAAPTASGQMKVIDGRWENFASGAVLTGIDANLTGDRDRFQLASFTAADTAGGHIEARGSVVLDRPAGPVVELSARLAQFRIAARDEAVITASGSITAAGPIGSPKITGRLTIDKGNITLPQSPSLDVARLDVIVVDSKSGKAPSPSPPPSATALLPAPLDLQLDAPGPIFVRGHGLDSQWRGRLTVRGTSAAPDITGRLEQIQGSFDLLGKTFQLTRGAIVFGGGSKLDPTLDIVAEASAADITARVVITGLASAPKIALASIPALPEDEILARVLFGQSLGRISAAQGLQLAQAAAALAGGGPGMLDKLRGKLGLDWLRLGEASSGPASSILNPALANPAGTGNAAVSAGKYLMPGVSVGVTQGVSPPTSKVTVQIELRPHVTVQGEAGQSGNTGIGLNYQYDY